MIPTYQIENLTGGLDAMFQNVMRIGFVVREIKLLDGKNGRYISMPKRRIKNKDFTQDFSYPINNETRLQLLEEISKKYDDETVEE